MTLVEKCWPSWVLRYARVFTENVLTIEKEFFSALVPCNASTRFRRNNRVDVIASFRVTESQDK